MKKFKTRKKRKTLKLIVVILLIIISFKFTYDFFNKKRGINPEKYIKSLVNIGFNNQINNYSYDNLVNLNNNYSLIEHSLDFNISKNIDNNKKTIEYIEKVNKTMNNPIIYIYNTHDSEEYKLDFKYDYSIIPNVKIASYVLQEKLENLGINSIVETRSIKDILNQNNWLYRYSYKASRIYLEDVLHNNPSLKYFIDIHRDSSNYDKSTIEYNGNKYASILFVVGLEHENYEKNLELSNRLSEIINSKISGLSKGISKKEGPGVNGVYNQDFSNNLILIEIGGVDNNIKEVANSINIIGESIYDYIKENTNGEEKA